MNELSRIRIAYGAVGLLLFPLLIYASVLPLEYVPIGWERALERWKTIPWLQLGVSNRADWIANGLVVLPITFCLSGFISYQNRFRIRHLLYYALLLSFTIAIIVGIELIQAYFPRRTMSLNDIVAGWIGALLGVLTWFAIGEKGTTYARICLTLNTIAERIQWIAFLGCIASVLYSLYPFDFVISRHEFHQKIANGKLSLLGVFKDGFHFESLKSALSSWIRMVPFGIYLGLSTAKRNTFGYLVLFSLLLELIQIPIYSKYSSLVDWGTGFLGGLFGLITTRQPNLWEWVLNKRLIWSGLVSAWIIGLYLIYIGVLPLVTDRSFLDDQEKISLRWRSFLTPPFLRYYYPSEYVALTNVLGKSLTFAGLGVLLGAYSNALSEQDRKTKRKWIIGFLLLVCVSVEFGQIYVEKQIADSTDVLIYIFGGISGYSLFNYILCGAKTTTVPKSSGENLTNTLASHGSLERVSGVSLVLIAVCLSIIHPGWPGIQLSLTLLTASIAYFRPLSYSFLYVFLLITGDAYPLTGQLLIQEYDSLLLAGSGGLLGTGVIRFKSSLADTTNFKGLGWLLITVAMFISLIVGAYRLPSGEFADQLSVYFNKWNAIRVNKGLFWGLLFCYFTSIIPREYFRPWRISFVLGILASSLYVGLWVLIERAIFPGFFNLSDIYRATGPFFTMHIGDQHIDAFLVIAFPVACGMMIDALRESDSPFRFRRICPLFLITLLLSHAIFATMSRGPVLALIIQCTLLILADFWRRSGFGKKHLASIAILLVPLLGLLYLVANSAVSSRFDSYADDTLDRWKHWSLVVGKSSTGVGGALLGHGAGCFPTMMAIEKGYALPPLRWESVHGESIITLRAGWPIFIDRLVQDKDHEFFGVAQILDTTLSKEELQPYRVEKSLLHSYRYDANQFSLAPDKETHVGWPKSFGSSSHLSDHRLSSYRPVYVGVAAPQRGDLNIRNTVDSNSLISGKSSFPWMFTCDDHLVWRAKNIFVHAYYEQGLIGVFGWMSLFVHSFSRVVIQLRSSRESDPVIGWITTSIIGFFIVGMFGTLVDTPWLSALILSCTAFVSLPSAASSR